MQLEHHFTVPVPPDVAWEALLDPERVAPCFPGATLSTVDGSQFTGTVKVRLGPIAMLYKGKGRFTSTDAEARRATIEASGRDSRGNSTASAVVAVTLKPLESEAGGTAVDLVTDLTITGRPAQLGRGLIADVGGKIVSTFAGCLADRLGAPPDGSTDERAASPQRAASSEPAAPPEPPRPAGSSGQPAEPTQRPAGSAQRRPAGDTATRPARGPTGEAVPSEINLIEVAGTPVLKRLAPALLAALVTLLVLRRLLRRST
jgi:uncharacterized protein